MVHDQRFADPARTWDERFSGPDFLFGTRPNAYLARQHSLHGGAQAGVMPAARDYGLM